ncbi:ribonuclease HI family protein [Patescibacteria group bacterium]|nr:MAG: ribonuclease HI family protein [Patescibacteria group bacterium]
MKLITYSDGGSRGNPGPACGGAVVKTADGEVLETLSRFLGRATNNVAEYTGIVIALEAAKRHGATEVEMRMDSELAVKQLKGEYKVKNPDLAKLFMQVHNLALGFKRVTFKHVRREQNTEADAAVNACLDAHT